jgi:hypothetical protein
MLYLQGLIVELFCGALPMVVPPSNTQKSGLPTSIDSPLL